jgi:hypothetical protein
MLRRGGEWLSHCAAGCISLERRVATSASGAVPEADPACKDPSRAYWLPSRPAGVAPETGYHPGPLLDPRTLPQLPPEPKGLRTRLARLTPTA